MDFALLFLAFVALISIYFYLIRNYDYWRLQNVPHATGAVPGFGHILPLLTLRENFGSLIARLYERMDRRSMYGCYVMQTPALLIREPDLIKVVLQSNFSSFRNNVLSVHAELDPIMSRNPFFARDELWRTSRLLLSANFSGKRMRFIFSNAVRACEKFTRYIDCKIGKQCTNAEFESRELFARVSGEVVARSAFGIDGQCFEDTPDRSSFASVANRFFDATPENAVRQTVRFFLPKVADRLGVRFVTKELDSFIRQHLRAFIKSTLYSDRATDEYYQFSVEKIDEIDEDSTMAQATSLLFDGYEACTNVLSFMMYRLAENVEIQDRAREEVAGVLDKFDHELTYEAVKKMDYLDLVIQETLRMHPVFGDLSRVCTRETTLRGSDGLGCHLRPGDMVLISPECLHMDEEFWPSPTVFDPERFDLSNKASRNRYTFLGFSEGARICPGKRMGMMIVKAVAAVVLQRYRLDTAPRSKGPLKRNPNSFASVVEGGLWIRFSRVK